MDSERIPLKCKNVQSKPHGIFRWRDLDFGLTYLCQLIVKSNAVPLTAYIHLIYIIHMRVMLITPFIMCALIETTYCFELCSYICFLLVPTSISHHCDWSWKNRLKLEYHKTTSGQQTKLYKFMYFYLGIYTIVIKEPCYSCLTHNDGAVIFIPFCSLLQRLLLFAWIWCFSSSYFWRITVCSSSAKYAALLLLLLPGMSACPFHMKTLIHST